MDPDDLTDMGDIASDGADLAVNSPDIAVNVAPSSFDITGNYQQELVTGTYLPGGVPVSSYGADATLATLTNQMTLPTGTEDAVAYSAAFNADPTYTDTVCPTDVTNTATGGPVDTNAMGTQPTDPTTTMPYPSLAGIKDAVSGLVSLGKTVANLNSIAQRTPYPSAAQQGAPMAATRSATQAPVPSPQAGASPATLALLVGGIGLLCMGIFT